jgi:hypothetical protein
MTEEELREFNEKIRFHGKPTLFVCRSNAGFLNMPKFKCVTCKKKFEGPDAREDYQAHRKLCAR